MIKFEECKEMSEEGNAQFIMGSPSSLNKNKTIKG